MFGHLVYSPQYATFLPQLVRIDCSGETYRMSDINAQLGCSLKATRSSAVMCRRAVGRKPTHGAAPAFTCTLLGVRGLGSGPRPLTHMGVLIDRVS